ncbi:MAG: hypothetical protein FWG35_05390 [Spirochaetaceae bacterium]|nr:hypothetical protein [Spirochaetaceae bacterium]
MRKIVYVFVVAAIAASFAGCGSTGNAPKKEPVGTVSVVSDVRRPDVLDHKNYSFGRDVPEWVMMERGEIEDLAKYESDYVFKFEESGANLNGVQLWARNFSAASELAQQIQNRVQVKFGGASVGDRNDTGGYMEAAVKSLSDATFSGYRERENYWLKRRHYKQDGSVDREDFTYYSLYTIPRKTLDGLIAKALGDADTQEKPKTENEKAARERVRAMIGEGI